MGTVSEGPELEITPEPSAPEREAVERVLADERGVDVPPAYVSPWRRSGLPAGDEPEPAPRI